MYIYLSLKSASLFSLTELYLRYKLITFFLTWVCYYFATGLSPLFPLMAALEPI